ncbi:hypothetical protein B0H13DRAFT_2472407 [Mycena leptocephala]|nr:hypothetical protein B0H13DRAFT_2472407 [Mycena leptocephala]
MRDVSRSAVTIALSPPSFMMTFIPSNGPRFGASTTHHQLPFPLYAAALHIIKSVDHQGVLPLLFSSSSPLPSLPPAFLPQIAGPEERARIVDAICARGGEMMMHQGGTTGRSALIETVTGPEERHKIVICLPLLTESHCTAAASSTSQKLLGYASPEGSRLRGGGLLADCVGLLRVILRRPGEEAASHGGRRLVTSLDHGALVDLTGAADLHVVPPPPLFIDADSNPAMILIASVLLTADKNQRAALYDRIRVHIVTLRGCKTVSKVIWLFDRMRAYYGFFPPPFILDVALMPVLVRSTLDIIRRFPESTTLKFIK